MRKAGKKEKRLELFVRASMKNRKIPGAIRKNFFFLPAFLLS
jgi:hypothetical protein